MGHLFAVICLDQDDSAARRQAARASHLAILEAEKARFRTH